MSRSTVRLGLVDDHALFREGLKDLLLAEPDFEIVAEGGNGYEALSAVSLVQMDVLLIDLRMPRLGGVSAIAHIRKSRPELKIIVVSMFEDDDHRRQAVSAGADGYHSKMDDAKSIVKTIRALMAGKNCVSEEDRQRWSAVSAAQSDGAIPVFTETEYRVLEELARGDSNKDIASRLAISEQTLKNHLGSIFKKLGVKNRLEAVRRAMERNLILPPV
jgi:DNA-binding NarL/FixJ family response regulator